MPENIPNPPYDPDALRRRAEEAATRRFAGADPPSPNHLPHLVHELRVHQIELQMQNRALRDAQAELETSRDRYADLFDFAPVGYVTVDEAGSIEEINLTACEMLGVERDRALGQRLARYIQPAAKDRFKEFLRTCRRQEPGEESTAEFTLGNVPEAGLPVLVRSGVGADPHTDRRQYRLTLTDIRAQKQAEDDLRSLNATLEQRVAERTGAMQLLRDVASKANRAQTLEEALEYCLRRVAEHTGWRFGHAWLPADTDAELLVPAYARYAAGEQGLGAFREWTLQRPLRRGECLPGLVYASAEAHWITDVAGGLEPARAERAKQLGLVGAAAFPVMAENRVAGVLEFFAETPIEPEPDVLELMTGVGAQLGRVIERKAFEDRLLTLSEDEQRRIGQELHDDVGQELTGLALHVETLEETLPEPAGPLRQRAEKISAAIARIRRKIRNLSRGLVPMEIDAPALETALEGLSLQATEDTKIQCAVHTAGEARVADRRTATQLYRIAQEAVCNAMQHSQAGHVTIELRSDPSATVLEICDDGRGLPEAPDSTGGRGLQIMRHRAGLLGGALTVESSPAGGTRVQCYVPRKPRPTTAER